jgi:hypothetical protein
MGQGAVKSKNMSVLEEILSWSEKLENPWVRDALRRIVTQAEISESDIEELAELCKKPLGLSKTRLEATPLAADHLPKDSETGAVNLVALTHISDVNALAPNETINFGKTGLTIVYGDNGAGKSGYGRIMKRACRARGSGEAILANQLSEKPAGPPTAKFTIAVGEDQKEYVWKDGAPGPAELGAISVFDTSAAQVYVSDKTEVRFRPLGLDVMDKLGEVYTRVKARLENEQRFLFSQVKEWPVIPADTEAGRLLSGLTALTKQEDVDKVAKLTPEERQELQDLTETIATAKSEDPSKKALDQKNKAARLRRLAQELGNLNSLLDEKTLADFVAKREAADSSAKKAVEAAESFGKQADLSGLGSSEWHELWEAARSYSENSAYSGHTFPHTDKEAKCVLCQQKIDKPTAERLLALEEFVKGAAQTNSQMKRRAHDELLEKYRGLKPGAGNKDAIDDLAVLDTDVFKAVSTFLSEASASCTSIVSGEKVPTPVSALAPIADLERLASGCELRAAEIVRTGNPAELKRSEARLSELKARSVLEEVLPQIHAEIDRKGRINAYELCVKSTDTRALTTLSTDLTKKYVTDSLVTAFDDELKRLEFVNPELALRPDGAKKGVLFHRVFLKHATKADLAKVVSEGESRCIALAAFMAEVRGASHPSAIVFDDPVSSLDHRWRSNVTKRLVEEAKTRQVIVFTHEIVFLTGLLEEAELWGVPCSTQTVSRGRDFMAGHIDPELPWEGKSVSDRIKSLKQAQKDAEKIYTEQGEKAYEPSATRAYARLRQTWEKAVEEVLLNQSVVRFRRSIQTQRLKKLSDITDDDLAAINAGMTKTSKFEGGHDHAQAAHEPVPAPSELKTDIEQLEKWVDGIRARRK